MFNILSQRGSTSKNHFEVFFAQFRMTEKKIANVGIDGRKGDHLFTVGGSTGLCSHCENYCGGS